MFSIGFSLMLNFAPLLFYISSNSVGAAVAQEVDWFVNHRLLVWYQAKCPWCTLHTFTLVCVERLIFNVLLFFHYYYYYYLEGLLQSLNNYSSHHCDIPVLNVAPLLAASFIPIMALSDSYITVMPKQSRCFRKSIKKIMSEFIPASLLFPTCDCLQHTCACLVYNDQCYMSGHVWCIKGDSLWMQSRVRVTMLGYLFAGHRTISR